MVSQVAELQKINRMIKTEEDYLQDEQTGKLLSYMKHK